ncbi:MAG: DUF1194 domain-containing protein [Hyphomicrobiaceae bacterium]|nr:MAG: DUF1194 domain-containing protein [Hyphomicrobiaceae bacterium]
MAAVALALAGLVLPRQACAQEPVDLALVLAVDTSGSVNQIRYEMQKRGYAAAFRHPNVLDAIRSGRSAAIMVTMTQWTGPETQIQVIPWRRIDSEDSARAFAAEIDGINRRLFGGGTSISGAIDHAVKLLEAAPFRASRRVIDVSGDGSNNRGRHPSAARDEAVDLGIAINGLPILELEPLLDKYYTDNVVGGPGAFMIVAKTFEQFEDAIRRKLILEIGLRPEKTRRYALSGPIRSAVLGTPFDD